MSKKQQGQQVQKNKGQRPLLKPTTAVSQLTPLPAELSLPETRINMIPHAATRPLRQVTVWRMQQEYGNRAVLHLLQQQGKRTVPNSVVQCQVAPEDEDKAGCQCGGACAKCSSQSSNNQDEETGEVMRSLAIDQVQRLSLSDLDPRKLYDKAKGLANKAYSAISQATGWASGFSMESNTKFQQEEPKLKTNTEAVGNTSKQQANTDTNKGNQVKSHVGQQREQMKQAGLAQIEKGNEAGKSAAAQIDPGALVVGSVKEIGEVGTGENGKNDSLGGNLQKAVKEGLGEDGKWSCEQSEILAVASNVTRTLIDSAVDAVYNASKGTPLEPILNGVSRINKLVKKGAKVVNKYVKEIGKAIKTKVKTLTNKAFRIARKGLKYVSDGLKKRVRGFKTRVKRKWKAFKTRLGQLKNGAVNRIKSGITNLKSRVNAGLAKVREWISKIPLANSLLTGVQSRLTTGLTAFKKAGKAIRDAAKTVGKVAVGAAKIYADQKVREIALLYKITKQGLKSAGDTVKNVGTAIAKRTGLDKAINSAKTQVKHYAGKVKKAAKAVKDKALGKVCAALGAGVGPCVEQYLPDVGEGGKNSLKLAGKADVTVPLHEVGVPANLKVGNGASLVISRQGENFTVTISGEGILLLNEGVGVEGSFGVSLPTDELQKTKQAEIWQKLTGNNKKKALSGPQGSSTGFKAGTEAEAGMKGNVTKTYAFQMGKSNCDGLGGLVALLGAYGLSAALPEPFGSVLKLTTEASFASNMTSCLFTAAAVGTGKVELVGGGTSFVGEQNIEVAQTVGTKKVKAKDVLVRSLTLKASLSAQGGLNAALPGGISPAMGGGVKGTFAAGLGFHNDQIQPTTASLEGEGSVYMGSFDPAPLVSIIPSGEVRKIMTRLTKLQGKGITGTLVIKVSAKVTNLNPLAQALDRYFSQPISAIDSQGILKEIQVALEKTDPKTNLSLILKTNRKLEVKGGGAIAAGPKLGVSGEAGVYQEGEYPVYPAPAKKK